MLSPVKVWRNQKQIINLAGCKAKVISFTIIRVPPSGFSNQAPYTVVVVKLEKGRNVVCQLVDYDPEKVKIGLNVVLVVRRITEPDVDGIIPYGIKARIIE